MRSPAVLVRSSTCPVTSKYGQVRGELQKTISARVMIKTFSGYQFSACFTFQVSGLIPFGNILVGKMVFGIVVFGKILFGMIFCNNVWFPKGDGLGFPKGKGARCGVPKEILKSKEH